MSDGARGEMGDGARKAARDGARKAAREAARDEMGDGARSEIDDGARKAARSGASDGARMRTRVITGAVYSISLIALAMIDTWTTVLLCSALSALCAYEFYRMLRADAKLPNEVVGVLTSGAYPIVYMLWHFDGLLTLTVLSATVLLIWYVFSGGSRIGDVAVTLFGSCYTGLMLSSLVEIRGIMPAYWGGLLVVGVMLSVWGNDAFAFFFGSRFGRHKLAPHISPNKSWEGFAAGIVASVIAWCLIHFIPGLGLSWPWAIVAGLVCGIGAILGDLVESRIKRSIGFKDSGHLLPGHGGFLDRCDSLLVVAALSALIFRLALAG